MKTSSLATHNYALLRMVVSVLIVGAVAQWNPARSQHWIQTTDESKQFGETHPWVIEGQLKVPCPGNDCGHDNYLHYIVTEDLAIIDGHTYVGEWFSFSNPDPTCNMHFTVCSMVQFMRPHSSHANIPTQYWSMTRTPADNSTPHFQKPCTYTCAKQGVPRDNLKPYWSYYFGCKEVNFEPGQAMSVFDGWHEVTSDISSWLGMNLSQDFFDPTNTSATTWNFNGQYTDFQEGCSIDATSCADLMNSPNNEIDPVVDGEASCPNNGWSNLQGGIIKRKGGNPLSATVSFPNGNQRTMASMNAYPATFRGILYNAPAGTELRYWAPTDTVGGMIVLDSGHLFVPSLSGCTGDTVGFSFPFLIPPMMDTDMVDPGMMFRVVIPDSCGNIGNGRRIELRSQVYARSTSTDYDSGTYMYWTDSYFTLDSTPPTISTFELHQIDSNHLAIKLQGSEDTTMIDKGYIKYRENGGPELPLMLRFENNDTVNRSTIFRDTLVTSVAHPTLLVRGFVGNEVGLTDSTAMDTCRLVTESVVPSTGVHHGIVTDYLYADRDGGKIKMLVRCDASTFEVSLVTLDGKKLLEQEYYTSPVGSTEVQLPAQGFAHGGYFLTIRTQNDRLIRRIVL